MSTSSEPRRPVALVTGGARGIGEAITAGLVRTGHRVAVVDVNERALDRLRETPEARDGVVIPLAVSITDRAAVERAVGGVVEGHGPIAALVNNAGMTLPGSFLDQTDEDWHRIVDVNLFGTFVMSQVVARTMVEAGGGSIVNISSVSAHGVRTGPPAYAAAKAGVEGLGRLMADQLGLSGVRVNTVVVGTTATPWLLSRKTDEQLETMRSTTRTGAIGEPEDVAEAVLYLASPAARHVTGQAR